MSSWISSTFSPSQLRSDKLLLNTVTVEMLENGSDLKAEYCVLADSTYGSLHINGILFMGCHTSLALQKDKAQLQSPLHGYGVDPV